MFRRPTILAFCFMYSFVCAQKPDAIKAYNAGLQYYHLHNYVDATPFFQNALKKDPSFIYAYRVLIICHEQQNQLNKAIELYHKVIELSPSDKQLCYNLALSYLELKDYKSSIDMLKKALYIDPAYTKAANKLHQINTLLAQQSQKDSLRSAPKSATSADKIVYQKALDLYKKEAYQACINTLNSYTKEVQYPNFYYLKAIALQHEGKRSAAILAYENTLELDDRHFNANYNLGKLFYNDQDYQSSIHLLETAYQRRKNDLELCYILAKAHYYNKEYNPAIDYLEDYIKRNSDLAEAWVLLGDAYSKIGKSRNAADAYQKAQQYGNRTNQIEQQLDNQINNYGKQASAYAKKGNYQEAINLLEKAISEHSETASLHFNLGLNYLEIGNSRKAREEFKKTIELNPAHAKAYQGLALIYYEREQYNDAAAYYLATIDAGKQDEFVYYKLGSCYFRLKRYDSAAEQYQQAILLNASEKQYHYGLGLAYLYNEHYLKSIEVLKIALKIDPNFLDAQYHMCVDYFKTNDYKDCIAEAQKILQKDANYAKAYLIIGHAYKRMGDYLQAAQYQKKAERLDPSLRQ